jgi:DNA helicase-2/ATP-dependent DNA helicase PcrA
MEKSPIAIQRKLSLKKAAEGIGMVLSILERIKNMPSRQALEEIIDSTRYEEHLETYAGEGDDSSLISRLENIDELLSMAEGRQTVAEFLEDCALRTEDEDDDESTDRRVRLSTIHAAKGLEFHTVFLVACEKNILPHWRSVDEDAENAAGGKVEEERRLFYVACTRAEQNLHISYAAMRQNKMSGISPFLEELSGEHLNRLD